MIIYMGTLMIRPMFANKLKSSLDLIIHSLLLFIVALKRTNPPNPKRMPTVPRSRTQGSRKLVSHFSGKEVDHPRLLNHVIQFRQGARLKTKAPKIRQTLRKTKMVDSH
jgi:hypothetical protein